MGRTTRNGDDAVKTAAACAGVLGATFVVVACATFGGRAWASVGVGAGLAIANLLAMRAIIGTLLTPAEDVEEGAPTAPKGEAEHREAGRRGGAAWGALGLLKILVLFGGVFVLLTKGVVDPIPLVVGYGVLPLGIAGSALLAGLRPR